MENTELRQLANFLFEAGMLQKTPRSWSSLLGSGSQSVAEHLNRVGYIGFILSEMNGTTNTGEVLKMCMFHDFAEARVSDLNYLHQKYTDRHEDRAIEDLSKSMPYGNTIKDIVVEYENRETLEAKMTKDADNLEFLLSLKEQIDIGNERAKTWIPSLLKRLLTEEGKALANAIVETESDDWWFADKNDEWWISRTKKLSTS